MDTPPDVAVSRQRICNRPFFQELKVQFRLAWPLSLSMLFHYLVQPISIAFCGHLGKTQLAAVAMATSVIYVLVVSFGRGLAFGGDTFFSQTYGSHNKKNVGIYLQKGVIFGVLWSLPTCALLLNTESILLLMAQDPEVASLTQDFCTLFLPGVPCYFWLFLLMRYLLCQNKVIANLLICIIGCGINAVLNYGLIYQAEMGVRGCAIALALTYFFVLVLFISYIWGSGLYRETWAGWSVKCLRDWGEFARVTTHSIIMTFLFWLCTEVGTFLGGVLSEKDLSAFSISFQIEGFAWMIPIGIGGACTARIGQNLGANRPDKAKLSARVALLTTMCISVILGLSCYATRFYIPLMFTTNTVLVNYTAGILQITAIFLLLEGFGGIGVGIIRGTGRQALGTAIIFISYYAIAWPVGIPLMFATNLALFGLWWGLVLGLFIQDVFLVAFVLRLNWESEALKAMTRSQVGAEETLDVTPNERTRLLRGADTDRPESSIINTSYTDENVPGELTESETEHHLRQVSAFSSHPPLPQLIVRRLLVFLFCCALLVAGVFIRLYVKVHVPWTSLCNPTNSSSTLPPCPVNGTDVMWQPF